MQGLTKRERQLTDPDQIRRILDTAKVLHLGLAVDNEPYVVPMNYGYTMEEGKFLDYSGAEMVGTEVTSDKVGYVKIQLPTAEGEDASYIYLKKPTAPETKYYAYQPSANDLHSLQMVM